MPTALIVEDEPEANKLLAMLVRLRGYGTESAFTGVEALAKLQGPAPDVVFLDLMLPDLNGYEVCQAIKSRKETALIPVVMVTARVAVENRIQSFCLSADQYVPKPYTPDQIFQAMDDAHAWLDAVAEDPTTGAIPFGSGDEGESIRRLGQLRSLLLSRTPMDLDSASRINEALRMLASLADTWGQAHGIREVARLDYRTYSDRIEFLVRDQTGWFRDASGPSVEVWTEVTDLGRFEGFSPDWTAGVVMLVKRFPASPTGDRAEA